MGAVLIHPTVWCHPDGRINLGVRLVDVPDLTGNRPFVAVGQGYVLSFILFQYMQRRKESAAA